jgi:hypothetical protein
MEGSFAMSFRKPIWLDAETWLRLKTLAGADQRAPRNYLHWLVRREWEARRSQPEMIVSSQPRPDGSPSIPSIYHIRQGK